MKITQDVREYADKHGVTSQQAITLGMESKSIEFIKSGSKIYDKV
jgi:phosphomethylpyrimidine synthase